MAATHQLTALVRDNYTKVPSQGSKPSPSEQECVCPVVMHNIQVDGSSCLMHKHLLLHSVTPCQSKTLMHQRSIKNKKMVAGGGKLIHILTFGED